MERYIGLDVHATSCTMVVVNESGKQLLSEVVETSARTLIDAVKRDIAARFPNDFVLATTADQILAARKQGKMAALMGIEGGHAIEDSLRLLRTYYDLGIRYMTLTHSNNNSWADSSGCPQTWLCSRASWMTTRETPSRPKRLPPSSKTSSPPPTQVA